MRILLVALCCVTFTTVAGKKPTLSDNRGLFPEEVKFNIKDYVFGGIWPKPQEESRGTTLFGLDPSNFEFTKSGESCDVLIEALTRYKALTFPDGPKPVDGSVKAITGLNVHVEQPYKPMELDMDEEYHLVVQAPVSSLEAKTVWGALRGLETFSQVVYQNASGNYFAAENSISDFPRFHHRGFLIDTSRHFLEVKFIKQFIDALAYSKYNVLHWHIVDSQSFPFVSVTYPSLHEQGAINSETHVYTPDDVQDVIEYARFRGIRVLSEFDTPGHTDSWFSIPHLLTPCYSGGKPNGALGPINPTVESNYEFLTNFFKEVGSVFPDKYLHLGGDEVSFNCWKSNPDITEWMKNKGMAGNYSMLEQYYEQRLLDIIGGLGKDYVIWQEVIDNNVKVKPDTVVNVWKGGWQNEMAKVTKLGYATILSSPWYLNYISYGPDWPNYYKVDPQAFNGTKEQLDLVIGGTACVWGEWIDATNLISRSWGRGLAVGERLWSSQNTTDINDAGKRIWEHRCRFLRRGISAENVIQSEYCRNEWQG